MTEADNQYFDSKDFKNLLAFYESARNEGKPLFLDSEELTDIADYYRTQGRFHEAHEAAEYGARIHPGAMMPLSFLTREALMENNIHKAIGYARQIEDKSDSEYQFLRAEIYVAKGKTDEANILFQDYCQQHEEEEDKNDIYIEISGIYCDYGYFKMASQWLDKADDTASDAYVETLAAIVFGLGQYEEAAKLYERLIDSAPYSRFYWQALANAHCMLSNYEEAVNCYDFCLAINPNDNDSLFMKANCLFQQDNNEAACKLYEKLYLKGERNAELLVNYAYCLYCCNNPSMTLTVIKELLQMKDVPSDILMRAHTQLAFVYHDLKLYDLSFESIDTAERMSGHFPMINILKGFLLLIRGEKAEADMYFRKSLLDGETQPMTARNVIATYYKENEYELCYQAIHLVKDIFDMDKLPGLYSIMAACCWQTKRHEEMMTYLQQATRNEPQEAETYLQAFFPDGTPVCEYFTLMSNNIKGNNKT